jgi:hypothetical protein
MGIESICYVQICVVPSIHLMMSLLSFRVLSLCLISSLYLLYSRCVIYPKSGGWCLYSHSISSILIPSLHSFLLPIIPLLDVMPLHAHHFLHTHTARASTWRVVISVCIIILRTWYAYLSQPSFHTCIPRWLNDGALYLSLLEEMTHFECMSHYWCIFSESLAYVQMTLIWRKVVCSFNHTLECMGGTRNWKREWKCWHGENSKCLLWSLYNYVMYRAREYRMIALI